MAITSSECIESDKRYQRALNDEGRILRISHVSLVVYNMAAKCTGQYPAQGIPPIECFNRDINLAKIDTFKDGIP